MMTSAFDDYIHWLRQDARRNHQHILMAKMAQQKELEQLVMAFEAGKQWQIQQTKNGEETEKQPETNS